MSKAKFNSEITFIDNVIEEHQKEIDILEKTVSGNFLLNSDTDPTHRVIRKHKDLIRIARERQSYLKREQQYVADRIRMDEQRDKERERMMSSSATHIKKKKKKRKSTIPTYGKVVDKSKATKTYVNSHRVSPEDIRKHMNKIKKKKKKKKKQDNFLTMALPIINKGIEKLNVAKKVIIDEIVYLAKYMAYSLGILKKVQKDVKKDLTND